MKRKRFTEEQIIGILKEHELVRRRPISLSDDELGSGNGSSSCRSYTESPVVYRLAVDTHALSIIYAPEYKFVIIFSTGHLRSGPIIKILSTASGHSNSLVLFDAFALKSERRLNTQTHEDGRIWPGDESNPPAITFNVALRFRVLVSANPFIV